MSPTEQNVPSESRGAGWFKTTHWSVVLQAAVTDSASAAAALEKLCQTYWYPLYCCVRRSGHDAEEAKDLTQEFFARLLEKNWLAQADANRGRFRSFLLGAMNHFLANEWRRATTAKRGGGRPIVSLDGTAEALFATEPASDLPPDKLYERKWALQLFERALDRLRADYAAADKLAAYEAFKGFLSCEAKDGDYARVGGPLGMTNAGVASAVHRMRQHYRELVRDEVAQTVAAPAELEDELRSLLAALE